MTEPTSLAAWVAGLSAAILALFGVDYYALFGALLGVLFTVSSLKATTRLQLLATVALTTLVAAVLGQGIAAAADIKTRAIVIAISLVVGAGGQVIVQACIAALVAKIQKAGGQQP
jgi:hypothetical protein